MIPEKYLEYLALDSIMQGWMDFTEFGNKSEVCNTFRYADGTNVPINLYKLKDRITELQKEFLEEYVIDSTSKDD